jgi:hypothetical protein
MSSSPTCIKVVCFTEVCLFSSVLNLCGPQAKRREVARTCKDMRVCVCSSVSVHHLLRGPAQRRLGKAPAAAVSSARTGLSGPASRCGVFPVLPPQPRPRGTCRHLSTPGGDEAKMAKWTMAKTEANYAAAILKSPLV